MNARVPALLLFLSVLLIAAVYAAALFVAPSALTNMLLAVGISGASVSVMAFGLPRRSRRARVLVVVTLVLTFIVTVAGFSYALRAPAPAASGRLLFGLPAGAAVMIYVVGLLPLVALPIVYALTFDDKPR